MHPGAKRKCRRCSYCNTCWPHDDRFGVCLDCEQKTWVKNVEHGDVVVPYHRAEKELARREFEQFYADKCRREIAAAADALANGASVDVHELLGA